MANSQRKSYGGQLVVENERLPFGIKEIELPAFEREVMESEDIGSDAVVPLAGRIDVVEITITLSDDYPELDGYRLLKQPWPFKILTSSERTSGSVIEEDSIVHICRGFCSESEGGTISQSERPEPEMTIALAYYQKLLNGTETILFDALQGGLVRLNGTPVDAARRQNLGFAI